MNLELARELFGELGFPAAAIEGLLSDLEFMARYKYDSYETFVPGRRFLEQLFIWLNQFRTRDRKLALRFVRERLIFISQREMQELARFLYYDLIVPEILEAIIRHRVLKPFQYTEAFERYFPDALRRCLFVALSDGAKIDFFRRHNVELSQEQVIPYYRTPNEEYVERLREDTGDPDAFFWAVFLIDDFTGSGYTLLHEEREHEDDERKLVGSLQRVYDYHPKIIDRAEAVYLCHYLATANAHNTVNKRAQRFPPYAGKFKTLAALTLPPSLSIIPDNESNDEGLQDVFDLCDRYFLPAYNNYNTLKGGGIQYGYGRQGLPLVLYSNTPNNSLFLIWYETRHPAQPFHALFKRIDRHKVR
jgi:hypothetical protein